MRVPHIVLFLVCWLIWVVQALPASAQQPSVALDRFRASETVRDDFHLSRPVGQGHLDWGVQLHLDYGLNPLVWERNRGTSSSEQFSIVEHELVGTVGFSLGLFDRLVVFAGLPVVIWMDGEPSSVTAPLNIASSDSSGLGDLYLGGRVRLMGEEDDLASLALQLSVTLPTGAHGTQAYRSEDHVTVHPELLGEVRPFEGGRIVLNLGAFFRDEDTDDLANLAFEHALTFGAGVAAKVWESERNPDRYLDVYAQIYGETAFASFFDRDQTNVEATVGAKYFEPSGVSVGLAGGPGITRGFGTPDLRLIGTVGFSPAASRDKDGDGVPNASDACPEEPEDRDGFEDTDGCPDGDNDADGIADASDACRDEPETVNGLDDEDGCPDEARDTDGDGLFDHEDACPEHPEDADGFRDEDGCDDPDNDADGVLDAEDNCRDEAGVIENRGCPDQDRDADGVVDRVDNCPDEPGSAENHGCEEAQQVVLRGERLEILDNVFFRTNRDAIQRRSFTLLRNVAAVLNAHPEISAIRVEGHTDARGRREHNLDLSQRRAEQVVRFLVSQGVDVGRLQARGFGPDRPVVPDASTADEHAQNRRVEFHLEGAGQDVQQRQSAAGQGTID